MHRLFLLAALVMFVLALGAATTPGLTLFTVAWQVWACAGFVAWVLREAVPSEG